MNKQVKYSLKHGDYHVIAGVEYRGRNPVYANTETRQGNPPLWKKIKAGIPFVRVSGKDNINALTNGVN